MTREHMTTEQEMKDKLSNRIWRLQNLYYIIDKSGSKVLFRLNKQQEHLLNNLHNRNVILKARQLGITTFFAILFLDHCLFNSNTSAGIIADKRESSEEIFKSKIKFALDNLHPFVKSLNPSEISNARELRFSNGSTYRVSTSMRSGTLQLLHISEFGKICKKRPDHAKEIVTGSLNTVDVNQFVTIESTAEGRSGYFYDYCKQAEKLKIEGKPLTSLDYKFHFFPWHENDNYKLDTTNILINKQQREYFESLLDEGIKLTDEQKAWYIKQSESLGDFIKQEYPSTPSESFESSNEGLYYGSYITKIRSKGQIVPISYDESLPVFTCWDLGISDPSCIWFFQTYGAQIRFIDYYEATGEGLAHFVNVINKTNYRYDTHFLPHDIKVKELGSGITRLERLEQMGLNVEVVPMTTVADGIEIVRSSLANCWFDSINCDKGVKAIESYRREWDDKLGCYKDRPLHDWASHPADALRMGLVGLRMCNNQKTLSSDDMRRINSYRGIYG